MSNHYEASEVSEIGRAQDVILGASKLVNIYDDGTSMPKRSQVEAEEDD